VLPVVKEVEMKAYRFEEFGGFDHLVVSEEPMPNARPGEVVVKIEAVSLNFRDVAIATGRHPVKHQPGLIPTSDAAGVVVEVGEGAPFAVGQRVVSAFHPRWFGGRLEEGFEGLQYGTGRDGWLTEYKAVSADAVVAIPDSLSSVQASTLPTAGLTAWAALSGHEPIRPGQTVLTLGTGGVSLFAIQLATAAGARVISTTSKDGKADKLRELGSDEVINYHTTPEWGAVARELNGDAGVDRVVEVGGAATMPQSLKAIATGAEVALVGFLAGANNSIDFVDIWRSHANIRLVRVGDRAALRELVTAVACTDLEPVIDRVFPFSEAQDAFRYLEAGDVFGKVVVSIS
jgi:NADPH:quinone reductase-like Zn-dependent oxidoreductase